MLVLSRKSNESIWVGNIEVRVLEVRGKRAIIGITAPSEVKILRDEIKERGGRKDERAE